MRQLAKLLLEVRKEFPKIQKLKFLLRAKHYKKFVTCVDKLADLDPRKKEFERSSVALDIGGLMRTLIMVMKDKCAITENTELGQWDTSSADTFNSKYYPRVNKLVQEKANKEKRNALT